jgi:hypothetical protein
MCLIRPSDIDDAITVLSRTLGPNSVRASYGLLRGPLGRAARDRDGVVADSCTDIPLGSPPKIWCEDISKAAAALIGTMMEAARLA